MLEIIIITACIAGLYLLKERKPYMPPTCLKCGVETVHYCGMACIELCPKCDVL